MLKENPQARPNIYQTLKAACAMQGREVPIKDVWVGTSYPLLAVCTDTVSRSTPAGRDRKAGLRRPLGKNPRRLLSELYSRRHHSMRQ